MCAYENRNCCRWFNCSGCLFIGHFIKYSYRIAIRYTFIYLRNVREFQKTKDLSVTVDTQITSMPQFFLLI